MCYQPAIIRNTSPTFTFVPTEDLDSSKSRAKCLLTQPECNLTENQILFDLSNKFWGMHIDGQCFQLFVEY